MLLVLSLNANKILVQHDEQPSDAVFKAVRDIDIQHKFHRSTNCSLIIAHLFDSTNVPSPEFGTWVGNFIDNQIDRAQYWFDDASSDPGTREWNDMMIQHGKWIEMRELFQKSTGY